MDFLFIDQTTSAGLAGRCDTAARRAINRRISRHVHSRRVIRRNRTELREPGTVPVGWRKTPAEVKESQNAAASNALQENQAMHQQTRDERYQPSLSIRGLDGLRTEPFDILPVSSNALVMSAHDQFIHAHGMKFPTSHRFSRDRGYPLTSIFLPWTIQHPLLFEALIASTLLQIPPDLSGKRAEGAGRYRDASLLKLLPRLTDPVQAIDDVTLGTVLNLLLVDASLNRPDLVRAHKAALQKIVKERDGLSKLGLEDILATAVLSQNSAKPSGNSDSPSLLSVYGLDNSLAVETLSRSPTFSRLASSGKVSLPTVRILCSFLEASKSFACHDIRRFLRQKWELTINHILSLFEIILINHLTALFTENLQIEVLKADTAKYQAKVRSLLSLEPRTTLRDAYRCGHDNCYIWMVFGTVGMSRIRQAAGQLCKTLRGRTLDRFSSDQRVGSSGVSAVNGLLARSIGCRLA
ncbi:hypothetical protein PV04_09688 [Phialophora macrospora]|uniref:Uncharacterized protein n=1 Tax=Phialophora macrospora TaxID=1851006 RepID=A0A0D2F9T3_9EURO|nr:hypothetical protein PV04_09688 [Phialophora macrospora]